MKHTLVSVLVGALGSMAVLSAVAIADPGSGHGPQGKGSCVSACENVHRDCSKKATSDRKTCYTHTCAPQRAAIQACHEGGPGHGSEDGVTDVGTGCTVAAQALRRCLQDCRSAFNASRLTCTQSARGCKIACGLPLRTPTPTPVP